MWMFLHIPAGRLHGRKFLEKAECVVLVSVVGGWLQNPVGMSVPALRSSELVSLFEKRDANGSCFCQLG